MRHYTFNAKRPILLIILVGLAWFGYNQFISKEEKVKPNSEQTTDSLKKNTGPDSATTTHKDTITNKTVVAPPTVVSKPDNNTTVFDIPEEKKPTDGVTLPKQPEKDELDTKKTDKKPKNQGTKKKTNAKSPASDKKSPPENKNKDAAKEKKVLEVKF